MNQMYLLLHEERLREIQRNRNHEVLKIEALGSHRKPVRRAISKLVVAVIQQVSVLKTQLRWQKPVATRKPSMPRAKA